MINLNLLERLKVKDNSLFEKFLITGVSSTKKHHVIITTIYGDCEFSIYPLLKGDTPSIQSAINKTEYWINQAKEKHGNLYDYSLVEYINSSEKVLIKCENNHTFEQDTTSHLNGAGCEKCYNERRSSTQSMGIDKFIENAIQVHGDKYSYHLVNYINTDTHVDIWCNTCKKSFPQTPYKHTKRKQGCRDCQYIKLSTEFKLENSYSYTVWEKQGLASKHFDSFKCYVIRCWNDTEEFFKIGKTFTTLDRRFSTTDLMPYNYEIVELYTGTAKEISELEIKLQKKSKKFKYRPLIKFKGITECFSKIIL